jgi:hypothetical protein
VHCFFARNINQISHVLAIRALPYSSNALETKTRCHSVADKSKYQGGKNVDQPAPPKSQDNRAFLLCAMRLNVGTKFVPAKERVFAEERVTFAFESKVSLAANRLRSRVAPSIWRKTVVPRRALCGGNCWG